MGLSGLSRPPSVCLSDPGGGRGGARSGPVQTSQLRGAAGGEGRGRPDGGDGIRPGGGARGAPLWHPAGAAAGAGPAAVAGPPVHRHGGLLRFPGPGAHGSAQGQPDRGLGRQRHHDPHTVVDKQRRTRGGGLGRAQCTFIHRGKNNPFCYFVQ